MCPINPSKQDVEQGMSHSTIYIYIIQIEYTYHLFWFRWKTTALFELYFLLLIDDVTLSFSIFVNKCAFFNQLIICIPSHWLSSTVIFVFLNC